MHVRKAIKYSIHHTVLPMPRKVSASSNEEEKSYCGLC